MAGSKRAYAVDGRSVEACANAVDVVVPEGLAPVDASAALREALAQGCRCVCVAPALVGVAKREARGRCAVATSCREVAGWPGASLLQHAGTLLRGCAPDELVIPADGELLADATWTAIQLRQVTALCHANGAFACVALPVVGLGATAASRIVGALRAASVDAVILRAAPGEAVSGELVAAALAAGGSRTRVRVQAETLAGADLDRLATLGIDAICHTAKAA